MTGYIYKMTSPSGKIYIGSTKDMNSRHQLYRTLKCESQIKLYNSLKKYGYDNHIVEVIEEPTLDTMLEREAYWGEYFDVLGVKGLNLQLPKGTDTYKTVSDETRLKMSESKIGNTNKRGSKLSEESKRRIKESFAGRKLSDSHRKRLSEVRKGVVNIKSVIDTSTMEIFDSLNEASKYSIYSRTYLSAMLGGKRPNKTNLMWLSDYNKKD